MQTFVEQARLRVLVGVVDSYSELEHVLHSLHAPCLDNHPSYHVLDDGVVVDPSYHVLPEHAVHLLVATTYLGKSTGHGSQLTTKSALQYGHIIRSVS